MKEAKFLTVKEYAELKGISREAVYKKVKKKQVHSEQVGGTLCIELGSEEEIQNLRESGPWKHGSKPEYNQPDNQPNNQGLVQWLKGQISELTEKVKEKDDEIRSLNEKLAQYQEESKEELKELQREKDLQIKNYFEFLANENNKLLAHAVKKQEPENKDQKIEDQHNDNVIDVDPDPVQSYMSEEKEKPLNWISLNKHLKDKKFKKEYRVKVMKDAQKTLMEDSKRFMIKDKKIYIDPLTYKYKDLF